MLASHHANTTAVKTFQEYKASCRDKSSETAALSLFHRENAQTDALDWQGAQEHWAALGSPVKSWHSTR